MLHNRLVQTQQLPIAAHPPVQHFSPLVYFRPGAQQSPSGALSPLITLTTNREIQSRLANMSNPRSTTTPHWGPHFGHESDQETTTHVPEDAESRSSRSIRRAAAADLDTSKMVVIPTYPEPVHSNLAPEVVYYSELQHIAHLDVSLANRRGRMIRIRPPISRRRERLLWAGGVMFLATIACVVLFLGLRDRAPPTAHTRT
ncbi:hypothetical protein B0T19DRAFT_112180 [Cercophora scortea]|uniref:Uncharacterized protein n=1 Tax=Cercophora scortea TaxID=314031 RepID=A0AAE0IWZ4_9PEZI|nr:hypothetical protein B0T19DRAFT_112180 [Cercophora scortea]